MTSNPDFTIVPADTSYLDFLADFGRRSFIEAYRVTLSQQDLDDYTAQAFARNRLAVELKDPAVSCFVCLDQGRNPCGYAKAVRSSLRKGIDGSNPVELQRLYIDARVRGQGVGSRLLSKIESMARDRGHDVIWLKVWDGNQSAIGLYRKTGYMIVGDEPFPVGSDSRTVLLMAKDLTSGV